jgi:hypothetical protein
MRFIKKALLIVLNGELIGQFPWAFLHNFHRSISQVFTHKKLFNARAKIVIIF